MSKITCPTCGGDGVFKTVIGKPPGLHRGVGSVCQACDGKGQVEAKSCSCGEPHISDQITHRYDGKPCYVTGSDQPKEPTKSQSFDDELEQTLNELAGYEGLTEHSKGCHYQNEIGCTCDYTADQNTKKEVRAALAQIKATVEKHYQLKEESND